MSRSCVGFVGSALLLTALAVGGCGHAKASAALPIHLVVSTSSIAQPIPTDFAGIGFETGSEFSGSGGTLGYFFSPHNTQLITLFQNIGIRDLRLGGDTVDFDPPPGTTAAGYTGVDNLFAFAQAAGVNVIYSLRLLDPSSDPIPNLATEDATVAAHIWSDDRSNLLAFAIGNEPDESPYHDTDPAIHGFPSYLSTWEQFAATVRTAVPDATFVGPDAGSRTGSPSYAVQFAAAAKATGVTLITQHYYVGGGPGSTTTQQAIADLLSPTWVNGNPGTGTGPEGTGRYSSYEQVYGHIVAPIEAMGLPVRFTEANDFLGGVAGASDGFASALWALDFMHWWAAHGLAGVNFHNNQWILTDTIVPQQLLTVSGSSCLPFCSDYVARPKAYAIKAFDLGGNGAAQSVAVRNPDQLNVTAYAAGAGRLVDVTVINKSYGPTGHTAAVSIVPNGFVAASAAEMVLTDGQPGNPTLLTATLGGASITNDSRWTGVWTPLAPEKNGFVVVYVPPSTAAIVQIQAAGAYVGPVALQENGSLTVVGETAQGAVVEDQETVAAGGTGSASRWTGWTGLPSDVAPSGHAVVVRNLIDTLGVAVPTGTGVLLAQQVAPNGPWGAWTNLGGSALRHLAVQTNADGSVSLFGLAANGHLAVNTQSAPGVGWSGWNAMGGPALQPGYVVGKNLSGLLQVFGVSQDGQIWTVAETVPGTWGSWQSLHGDFGPGLAVSSLLDGRLMIFGLTPSGLLREAEQVTPGGRFGRWQGIGGIRLAQGFVVGQNASGELVVFGVKDGTGATGAIWSLSQRGTSGWGGWTDLGGNVRPTLTVGNSETGAIQLLATGADSALWSIGQDASGAWGPWSNLGGTSVALG